MSYQITETEKTDGRIEWTAENDEGEQISGVLTRRTTGGAVLTNEALDQMAEKMIGVPVQDRTAGGIMNGRLRDYSVEFSDE